MLIQPLIKDDLDSVTKLFVQSFNAPPWNDRWTYELAYKRLLDIIETNRFIGIVAIEEGEILGAILGHLEYWFEGNHYNLREIFVSSKAQGKGVGSKMLKTLEELLKEHDVTEQMLYTLNAPETIAFYEKNGYHKEQALICMMK